MMVPAARPPTSPAATSPPPACAGLVAALVKASAAVSAGARKRSFGFLGCTCPLLAQSGRHLYTKECPFSGVKRAIRSPRTQCGATNQQQIRSKPGLLIYIVIRYHEVELTVRLTLHTDYALRVLIHGVERLDHL